MLHRKMLRDIWAAKTSFLAIFLLMLMGSYIFSGITSEYHGMEVASETFMRETHMADASILGNELPTLSDGKSQEVMVLSGQLPEDETVTLNVHVIKENTISQMKIMEGERYDASAQGLWLDERFAKAHGLQVHDIFRFQIGTQTMEEEILGLVLSPEYIYQIQDNQMVSDHSTSGYLYLNATSITLPFQPNTLLVENDREDLKEVLLEACASTNSQLIMKEDHLSYSMIHDEINQHKELGMIFSLTFLSIAMLVSITTIHRLLQTQATMIGILKALGFTRQRLYFHYCSHCALIALVASILGCFLGTITFSNITYPFMSELYTLPILQSSSLPFTYGLPLICMGCSILISLRICHRYLHGSVASMLSGGSHRKIHYRNLPRIFSHASFITQWNLRDILRNRLRSLMSIFGVFGCSALLIGAFGIYTTITEFSTWTFVHLESYECKVSGNFDEDKRQQLVSSMQGDELMNSLVSIQTSLGEEQLNLTVLSDTRYSKLATDRTTFISLNDGIAVSKNIADQYAIKQGDIVTWRLLGSDTWLQSQVEAIIRSPLSQGITMMKQHLSTHDLTFTPNAIVGYQPDALLLNDPQITSIQYQEDLLHNVDTMMDATIMMIAIFSIAAVLLGSVILYNLGSLAYMERSYELATLKVLGFQNKSIRRIMIQQNIWLTILGILLGIPGGYWLLAFMLKTIQSTMDVMMYLPWSVLLGCSIGTLLLSLFIITLVSKKVSSIDMVSALKANE